MSDKSRDESFQAWVTRRYRGLGFPDSTFEAMSWEAWRVAWAAKEAADLIIANEEKHSHLVDSDKSDDGDYDCGYSEAAQEIERRIKEGK